MQHYQKRKTFFKLYSPFFFFACDAFSVFVLEGGGLSCTYREKSSPRRTINPHNGLFHGDIVASLRL